MASFPVPLPPAPPRRSPVAALGRAVRSSERLELVLAGVALVLLAFIAGMLAYVFGEAWPSFRENGLGWFSGGDNVNEQFRAILNSPADPKAYVYDISAGPLIMGTAISTLLAAGIGLFFALMTALFIVEFAPPGLAKLMTPVVRLLAAVPSVVYGLVGVLAVAPWVNDHVVSDSFGLDVRAVVPISGTGLLTATLILTVMITPIMVAIIAEALRSVPPAWLEGSAALGVNRWRTMWRIGVSTCRPAIAAAVVLACARALGEAIMLAMVGGLFAFTPNPLDGLNALTEPIEPLAAAIVGNSEGLSVKPFGQTLYSFAALLLIASFALSVVGYMVKQPLRRYGVR